MMSARVSNEWPGQISFWAWALVSLALMIVLIVNLAQLNVLPSLILAPFVLVSAVRAFSIAQSTSRREPNDFD